MTDSSTVRARRWENWLSTLSVCHRQVRRAMSAPPAEADGECGLAVVSTATMLEAYINFHATEQFFDGEHLVPQHLIEPLRKLAAKHRYQLLPRFASRLEPSQVVEYEGHEIHKTIERVFALRNKFVHGDLEKWDPVAVTVTEVARLWNGALDVLLVLETVGEFRIPRSRLKDYEGELAALRVAVV
jgi:hypothetical protein